MFLGRASENLGREEKLQHSPKYVYEQKTEYQHKSYRHKTSEFGMLVIVIQFFYS